MLLSFVFFLFGELQLSQKRVFELDTEEVSIAAEENLDDCEQEDLHFHSLDFTALIQHCYQATFTKSSANAFLYNAPSQTVSSSKLYILFHQLKVYS